ncbi:MAG: hypothetical protein KC475_06545 [Cyanobacteria bacterium HKST-UBA03]|nr:hypothetical protein [Cyanobacteria bacterium HKST-UBA03]
MTPWPNVATSQGYSAPVSYPVPTIAGPMQTTSPVYYPSYPSYTPSYTPSAYSAPAGYGTIPVQQAASYGYSGQAGALDWGQPFNYGQLNYGQPNVLSSAASYGATMGFQGPPPALGNWSVMPQPIPRPTQASFYYDDPESDGFAYGAPRTKALNAVAEGDEFSTGDQTKNSIDPITGKYNAYNDSYDLFQDNRVIRMAGGYANEAAEALKDIFTGMYGGRLAGQALPAAVIGAGHGWAKSLGFLKPLAHQAFGHHGSRFLDVIEPGHGKTALKTMSASEATVLGAYMLTASYVLANTVYSFGKTLRHSDRKSTLGKIAQATADAGETLLFQTAASLIIPAQFIAMIRGSEGLDKIVTAGMNTLKKGLAEKTFLGAAARKWVIGGIALAAMPVIAKVVDWTSDKLLDYTYKPLAHGLVNRLFKPADGVASAHQHAQLLGANAQKELLI